MKDDNTLREEQTITTNNQQKTEVPSSSKSSHTRSSGRGLYITAIVLGIIIAVLLVLYIFLSLTVKRPAHAVVTPIPPIARQASYAKMLDF